MYYLALLLYVTSFTCSSFPCLCPASFLNLNTSKLSQPPLRNHKHPPLAPQLCVGRPVGYTVSPWDIETRAQWHLAQVQDSSSLFVWLRGSQRAGGHRCPVFTLTSCPSLLSLSPVPPRSFESLFVRHSLCFVLSRERTSFFFLLLLLHSLPRWTYVHSQSALKMLAVFVFCLTHIFSLSNLSMVMTFDPDKNSFIRQGNVCWWAAISI